MVEGRGHGVGEERKEDVMEEPYKYIQHMILSPAREYGVFCTGTEFWLENSMVVLTVTTQGPCLGKR